MENKASPLASKQKVVVVYCRVSTEDQRDNGTSLETQESACLAYASQQGWKVLGVVKEEFSGKKLYERTLLIGCLKDVQQGKANVLLCYQADRLSRHQTHSLVIFDDICEAGAELWLVKHGKIEDSPMGRAMLSLYATGAAMEWDNIRERTMRGRKARVESGKIHGAGCELYGYRRDKELGVRRIYEPEASIVRQIFEWCVRDGMGTRGVAFRLNRQEVPPPSFGKKTYKDGRLAQWCKSQVMRILREPAYKGETIVWRYRNQGRHKMVALRPASEHIKMPDGTSPAIVSEQMWGAAQTAIAQNRALKKRDEDERYQYLLRGHIFCSVCGLRMYLEVENGRTPVYRCSSRQKGKACGGKRVPAARIDRYAWGIVSLIVSDPEIVAIEIERLRDEDATRQLEAQLRATKRELEGIERGQHRLLDRFRDVDDSLLDVLERQIKEAEKEKARVRFTIAEMEARLASERSREFELESLEQFCQAIKGQVNTMSFEDKRVILKRLNARVTASGTDFHSWDFDGNIPDSRLLDASHFGVTTSSKIGKKARSIRGVQSPQPANDRAAGVGQDNASETHPHNTPSA
jgi:site-specific DNA recombinase